MGIFNYYGLIIIVLILLPNIAFAALNKDGFKNAYENKPLEICEQIGRFGCFILMIVNVPYTYFGFWFDRALTAYLAVNGALTFVYLLGWIVLWKKTGSASRAVAVDNALGNISVFRRHAYKRSAFRACGSVRDNAYNAVVQKRRRRRK